MSDFFTTDLSFLGAIDEARDQRPPAPSQYQPHSRGGIQRGSIAGIAYTRTISDEHRAKMSAIFNGSKRPEWHLDKIKAGHEAAKQRRLEFMESLTPEQREDLVREHQRVVIKSRQNTIIIKTRYVMTPEHRAKIAKGNRGKTVSAEACAAISKALTGKKFSDETRAKMSVARQKRIISDETRAKISASNRGRSKSKTWSAEARAAISKVHKGKIVSAETRAKQSAALAAKWQDPDWVAKQLATRRSRPKTPRPVKVKVKVSREEINRKIGDAHRGKIVSAETRTKMSAAKQLLPRGGLTDEGRAKIVAACRKPKSAETRAKMSATQKLKHELKKGGI